MKNPLDLPLTITAPCIFLAVTAIVLLIEWLA